MTKKSAVAKAPAPPKTEKPHYRAYKPVTVTDGILEWTRHVLDNTVRWTEDDRQIHRELNGQIRGVRQQIKDMEARLATLPADNPAIRLYADEIRAILDEVQAPPRDFTHERVERFKEAYAWWYKILIIQEVVPKANLGAKFSEGRKPGTSSPVRKAIRKVLQKDWAATAMQVWGAIKAKPPRGMQFYDEPRLGKYIQTDGHPDTGWNRFQTVCSEERKKLKPPSP